MTTQGNDLETAQRRTVATLLQAMHSTEEMTHLSLKDVTELADEVARVLPAGNVVTMVLAQLASIKGRRVSENETRRMLNLLQQGMSTFLDKAAYLAFYTTPAILISGYQLLLKASGKDPAEAFPNGTWQFYLEFGLREDTARHACETVGFQRTLEREQLAVSEGDQLAAWLMAVAELITRYDDLLYQEWHERILLSRLSQKLEDTHLTAQWVARRPYGVPAGVALDYVGYRRQVFTAFVEEMLQKKLRRSQVERATRDWDRDETLLAGHRNAYQQQMSLLAMLEPSEFSDTRVSLPLERCQIAVQYRGNYFLVPAVHNGMRLEVDTIRTLARSILGTKDGSYRTTLDQLLVMTPRRMQRTVRGRLPGEAQGSLERLRGAPVMLNWDQADSSLTLSEIRRVRRSIGDHALTLIRTDQSMVFDQSHIFFDAIWGMAVAEILTNQAAAWLRAMHGLAPISKPGLRPPVVDLAVSPAVVGVAERYVVEPMEAGAEATLPVVDEINELRRLLLKRNEELRLTVNDLLILYRSLYNQYYEPGVALQRAFEKLEQGSAVQRKAAEAMRAALRELNLSTPAFLIPMDASAINPQDRIFPVTFRPQPPWTDIGPQHEKTWAWLSEYQANKAGRNNKTAWAEFNEARTYYLEMLRMFGVLMARYKEIALAGESFSTATLKILASVPRKIQTMLRNIPDRIDILNDMLKGTEVFSNAGRVADTSSLVRFITAKDDNEKKVLCWGIMTRADGVMFISLRDFRPETKALSRAGAPDVAQLVAQDFLDGYANGLRRYVSELTEIVRVRK